MTLYFLGGGNMASAIIARLQQTDCPYPIHVINRGEAKRQQLQQQFPHIHTSTQVPPLNDDDVLILAVKPQDMAQACASVPANNALVLSLAAGLPIATLSRYLNGNTRIIRIMPNTPVRIGEGVSGLYASPDTCSTDRQLATQLMQSCGLTLWLNDENQMHAITAISGSGSGYIFYLLHALQQAAQVQGFDAATAHQLSLQTFKGAVALAEQSQLGFHDLQQQVTSKNGTTHAALTYFADQQIAENLQNGIQAAANRSREMAAQIE